MPPVSPRPRFNRPPRRTLIAVTIAAGALGAIGTPSAAAAARSDLVLSGHAANNTVVVRGTGVDAGTYSIDGSPIRRFSGIRSLTIRGHGGHDVCRVVNPPRSLLAPPNGITCEGGNRVGQPRRGVLSVGGGRTSVSTYRPGAAPGSGVIVHRLGRTRQVIRFTGLAPTTDTVPSGTFTFDEPLSNDDVGVISQNVATGTWTIESLSHPGAFESATFANKGVVTVNATSTGDSVTLEPASPEAGISQLEVNASDSIALVGASVGAGIPVALSAGDTITGAGPAPQLVAGGVAAVAPNGIGPLTAAVNGFAATSTSGSIELHDTGSLAAGSGLGQLSQTGLSAGHDVTVSSAGTLTNDGPISGADVNLSASALDLTHGSVSAAAVTLAPASDGGAVSIGSSGGSGALGLSQASLSTIQTSALTIGGPATGTTTVAGPIDVSAPALTLEGSGGFGASGGGAITARSLTLTDTGAAGRPWTIGPASVADGVGSPIPYTTSSLAVNGGSGNDSFDLTPSTTTPMRLDGGGPAGGAPGDSLTFEAGGAAVTGAALPPSGDLVAAGRIGSFYDSMEQVRVVNRGQSSTSTSAPTCSLLTRTTKVTIGRGRKPKPAAFGLLAACSQTARASVTGTLTVTSGARRKPKASRVKLKSGPVTLMAGKIRAITLKIPSSALVALRSGARESLRLTLTATAGAHTARTTATVRKLTR